MSTGGNDRHGIGLKMIEKAIDLSLRQQPDLACITGDFITGWLRNADEYRRILRMLTSVVPVFACIEP